MTAPTPMPVVSDYVRTCTWRLLVSLGATPQELSQASGYPVPAITRMVDGCSQDGPGHLDPARISTLRWHRARLELRRALETTDRSGGPRACWPSLGWRSRDGRPGRGSTFLGTRTLARQVLMVTSGILEPAPTLQAAHGCHDRTCANPRHLVGWVSHASNADHRRLAGLGVALPARPEHVIQHLDVLDRRLADLKLLALLEARLVRIVPGGPAGGCWVIAGTDTNRYYTPVSTAGQPGKLHRLMVAAAGADLGDGLVRHVCDHRPCCRPGHLRANGTSAQNTADAAARGRLAAGGRHGRAVYDDLQVMVMREQARAGASVQALARQHGGHVQSVRRALRAETYTQVQAPSVDMPVRRRLTGLGVQVVRALVAVGATDQMAASAVGLTPAYVRDLAAGLHRPTAPGVLTPRPGPATGRRVGTGKLSPTDEDYAAARLDQGTPEREVARTLGVHPRTVRRAAERARARQP